MGANPGSTDGSRTGNPALRGGPAGAQQESPAAPTQQSPSPSQGAASSTGQKQPAAQPPSAPAEQPFSNADLPMPSISPGISNAPPASQVPQQTPRASPPTTGETPAAASPAPQLASPALPPAPSAAGASSASAPAVAVMAASPPAQGQQPLDGRATVVDALLRLEGQGMWPFDSRMQHALTSALGSTIKSVGQQGISIVAMAQVLQASSNIIAVLHA